jgi:hypothetical protein
MLQPTQRSYEKSGMTSMLFDAKPCGDLVSLKRTFVGLLKYFEWHAPRPIARAFVIRDSDCADAPALEIELRRIFEQSHFVPSFPVYFHATKCELETWLLADEAAISEVSRRRGKNKQIPLIRMDLESHRNAKELFRKALSEARLPVDPAVYREVAACADIGVIAKRCPHFQTFVAKLQDH